MQNKNQEIEITNKFYNKLTEHFNKRKNDEFSHYFNYRANILDKKNKSEIKNFCKNCFKIFTKKENLEIIEEKKNKLLCKCKICEKENEITDTTFIYKILKK